MSNVDHPAHYGGDTPYETIKVLEAWNWEMAYYFCIGNSIKYFSRLGKKNDLIEDLNKASWYGNKAVEIWERHQSMVRDIAPDKLAAERLNDDWKDARWRHS
jgi:hypothetical protein